MDHPTYHKQVENKSKASHAQSISNSFAQPVPKTEVSVKKLSTFDIVVGALAIIILASIFGVYLLWRVVTPPQPWVLALREDGDKSQLHALNWKSGVLVLIGESEGDWTPDIHLATSNSLAANIMQKQYVGIWNGGGAILLPNSEKILFTLRQNDRWQVNLVDLKTNHLVNLTESLEAEPFISLAPFQKLVAVSVPTTSEKMATLRVFSLSDATQVSQPENEALDTKGILSSNAEYLLYTTTLTRTEVGTDTENIYSTTLYVVDTKGQNKRVVYEFNHSTIQVPENYFFDFTPNNQFIVYQTPENQLYRTDIVNQNSTSIFTLPQNMTMITANIAPNSDYLVLLLAPQQNLNQAELHLVSLETGQSILVEETFQTGPTNRPIFLNHEQILYSSTPNKHVIYNISTNSKTAISASGAILAPPLLARDLGLIAFVTSIGEETVFNFFNPLRKDFVPNLSFEVQVRDANRMVIALDFDMYYVIFRDGEAVYIKDIYTRHPPTSIANGGPKNFSAHFTSNPRYLLYSASINNLTNLYYVDLRSQQSKLLVENARLLH